MPTAVGATGPRLRPRLRACLDLAPREGPVADVGSAHGRLARALLARNPELGVLATEARSGPARELCREVGGRPGISIVVGRGLEPLRGRPLRGAVIAGMGGRTIIGILSDGDDVVRQLGWLLLQAMQGTDLLHVWLRRQGFRLRAGARPVEAGRTYPTVLVAPPCA
ncbi:MAG TPA: tRNA (adenine(22)-N(1))-methyltransferase TrmK [Verrucomicrobiae bacterium]|nr:tRNA (adenine(22)-N(1))-methyltransferase TrmK [Verrucomicrobiae bacterium]